MLNLSANQACAVKDAVAHSKVKEWAVLRSIFIGHELKLDLVAHLHHVTFNYQVESFS
jgi:hypothetical protein